MKKIILLGPREPVPPTRGGAIEKLTWGLAKNLTKHGHDVTVISTCDGPRGRFTIDGVNVICISSPIAGSLFYFREMPQFSLKALKTIRNHVTERNVIIHSVYFYNLMLFPPLGKIPLVVTEFEHYPWIPEYLYHRPFISATRIARWELDSLVRIGIAQATLPKASAIVFISNYQKQMALRKLKLIRYKSIVIPNAVDTDFYRPIKADELREKLANGADLLLLFVGRLTPHKGLHMLIKSIGNLEPDYRNKLRLVVVGPKAPGFRTTSLSLSYPYIQYINHLIYKYDLRNNIIFVGQVNEEEMPLYYNAIDMLVHPSFVEAFGLVLIEAMACGKPILAFDIPPMNEIIENSISGLLTKPSAESLAEALRIVADNTKALKAMGSKARNIIEMKYSWRVILRKYLILYDELNKIFNNY